MFSILHSSIPARLGTQGWRRHARQGTRLVLFNSFQASFRQSDSWTTSWFCSWVRNYFKESFLQMCSPNVVSPPRWQRNSGMERSHRQPAPLRPLPSQPCGCFWESPPAGCLRHTFPTKNPLCMTSSFDSGQNLGSDRKFQLEIGPETPTEFGVETHVSLSRQKGLHRPAFPWRWQFLPVVETTTIHPLQRRKSC